MAAQIILIDATVKYSAGTPGDTQRGPRINVVCTLPDAPFQKLWGDPGDTALTSLKKGQSIKLAFDGCTYKLAAGTLPLAPTVPDPEPGREWSDEEKKAIANQIQMYALKYELLYRAGS
ncbi:hypothetical protein NDI39_29365 [Microcoleus sp. ZQ-A2]|nr:hypothetical protein [Microcoleus sp. FACHB-1]